MPLRQDQTPAVLSALLPGLGQLYQRRSAVAVIFFAVFTVAAYFERARYAVPWIALAAAAEAFWHQRRFSGMTGGGEAALRGRRWVFAGVGIAGFLSWFLMLAALILPVGAQLQVDAESLRLADAVRKCRSRRGGFPDTLAQCSEISAPHDPWGTPYRYRRVDDGFEIVSAGRDRAFGSSDDFVFRYR